MAQVLAALRRLVLFSLPSASAEPTPQDYSRVPLFRGPNPNNYQYYFGGLLHTFIVIIRFYIGPSITNTIVGFLIV